MIGLLLLGCAADPADTAEGCADAPVVTWENFGEGFLLDYCSACHAANAPDRYGAPPDAVFDTEAQAMAWADRILARAGEAEGTMPPGGGVLEDDRELLVAWLTCSP